MTNTWTCPSCGDTFARMHPMCLKCGTSAVDEIKRLKDAHRLGQAQCESIYYQLGAGPALQRPEAVLSWIEDLGEQLGAAINAASDPIAQQQADLMEQAEREAETGADNG